VSGLGLYVGIGIVGMGDKDMRKPPIHHNLLHIPVLVLIYSIIIIILYNYKIVTYNTQHHNHILIEIKPTDRS
jgi:hypothetical protein